MPAFYSLCEQMVAVSTAKQQENLLAILLGASLCADCGPKTPADRAEDAVSAAYASSEQAISGQLRDPNSAEFDPSDLRFTISATGMIVCGTVNAKNGFGGYTGKETWIAVAKWNSEGYVSAEGMIEGSSVQFWPAWRKVCRNNAVGIREMKKKLEESFLRAGMK